MSHKRLFQSAKKNIVEPVVLVQLLGRMLIDSDFLTTPDRILTKALNPNMTTESGAQHYYFLCCGAMEKSKNSSVVLFNKNKIDKDILEPYKDFM